MNKKLLTILKGTILVFVLTFNQTTKAQVGAALNFDAVNDYISVGAPINIPIGNSPYTIEAWIKPNAWSAYGIIGWGNYGAVDQVNALRLDATGGIYNYWWGHDLYIIPAAGIPSINLLDGSWHHISATFDGTTRKIYVDGFLKGSDTPGSSHNVPSTANFRIGSTCPPCGGEIFNGNIDEVRVWNIARTQCQINSYMKCEIPSTATGLVLNYHFNDGVASSSNLAINTILDFSGSSNTGSLTNFALTGPTSNWIAPGGVTSGSIIPAPPTVASGPLTVNSGSICAGNSFTIIPNSGPSYTITVGGSLVVTPASTSSYTVSALIGLDGCLLSPSVAVSNVTVVSLPLPVITLTASKSILCLPEELTLTASGATYYKWSMGGVGTTFAFYPTTTATYTVYGYDSNGCYNTAVVSATVNNCTDIEELNSNNLFQVYPNPSNGLFYLDVPSNTTITIIDALGNSIYTEELSNGKHSIDLTQYNSGLYFIRAQRADKNQTLKVIKD